MHLLIKDDTGETKVILLDTIVEPVVGVSAEVLLDSSLEEVSIRYLYTVILLFLFFVLIMLYIYYYLG